MADGGKDKYTAVWTSHTSISDFLVCPRAYYLKHVYKDPKTGHKVKVMSPPLALGQAVHEVVESLSVLPVDKRFEEPLMVKFDDAWKKVSGKLGGFRTDEAEHKYKEKGKTMLRRVQEHPGPIKKLAVKINMDLPYYWISEEDNIILCGKVDWLEYLPDTDSVHIIDFKTGKSKEDEKSLQLPIYHLLVTNTQGRKVEKASYWYLERDNELTEKKLPALDEAHEQVLKIAKEIKVARQLERFPCRNKTGCRACRPYEMILEGKGEFVGLDRYGIDVYILPESDEAKEDSILH